MSRRGSADGDLRADPGAASSPWHWHPIEARLRERAHDVVAVDLPVDQDWAGLSDGGYFVALSRPDELATRPEAYRC